MKKLLLALLLLVTPSQAGGPAPRVTAHVSGYALTADKYSVMRGSQNLPLTFNMALQNGDVVIFHGKDTKHDLPGASVALRTIDGRTIAITAAHSPYTVRFSASKPWWGSNVLMALWNDVTMSHDELIRSSLVRGGAATEPLSLRIPGLADGRAVVARGNRHFMLGWLGGQGPYRVVLSNAAGTVLEDEKGIATTALAIRSHTVALQPGRYNIVLRDAAGSEVRASFSAAEGRYPAPSASRNPSAEQTTDEAAELAASRNGAVTYEAYLRLYDGIAAGQEPAKALAEWITEGAKGYDRQ